MNGFFRRVLHDEVHSPPKHIGPCITQIQMRAEVSAMAGQLADHHVHVTARRIEIGAARSRADQIQPPYAEAPSGFNILRTVAFGRRQNPRMPGSAVMQRLQQRTLSN